MLILTRVDGPDAAGQFCPSDRSLLDQFRPGLCRHTSNFFIENEGG